MLSVVCNQGQTTFSGDSRMKKVGRALWGQGKIGGKHKYLPCMAIFHCFQD